MIVPPITLCDRDGCLGLFDSVDELRANLDADDVESGEYTAFDRRGAVLSISSGTLATFPVVEVESFDPQPERLAALLRGALQSTNSTSLDELLSSARAARRGFWLPTRR